MNLGLQVKFDAAYQKLLEHSAHAKVLVLMSAKRSEYLRQLGISVNGRQVVCPRFATTWSAQFLGVKAAVAFWLQVAQDNSPMLAPALAVVSKDAQFRDFGFG